MPVGIVVVSHSDLLARGVAELAGQMAEGVVVAAAGGDDDGGVGTSFERILAAIDEADSGDGVVLIGDLGSAVLTAEQAIEFLEPDRAEQVRLADAPVAEGGLAAATTAAGGADLAAVLAAAEAAGDGGGAAGAAPGEAEEAAAGEPAATAAVVLPNRLGLHARPAAQLAAALKDYDAELTIARTDTGAAAPANSVLSVVGLGAAGGVEVEIAGRGRDAAAAVEAATAMARDGFGEDADAAAQPASDEAASAGREASQTVEAAAERAPGPGELLEGVGVVDGTVIGPLAPLRRARPESTGAGEHDPDTERERLEEAKRLARAELEPLAGGPEGTVFAMHLALLDDPVLEEAAASGLARGESAEAAWAQAVDERAEMLSAMQDEVFAARGLDVRDVGDRVLRHLLGGDAPAFELPAPGAVVAAAEALPSDVPPLVDAGAGGLAVAGGSSTSHAAILARNLGLPLVIRLGPRLTLIDAGTEVVLDAAAGTLLVSPDPTTREAAEERAAADRAAEERARQAAAAPGRLADGTPVQVAANAASVAEAQAGVANGAEGIGLLRTEFLYLDRPDLPSEDEQVAALAEIVAAMQGRPVIVRTLDAGGDKPAPALELDPVRNGFLGVRGLRLSLARPALFRTQLRAILRVAAEHDVSMMFPMVTTVTEVRAARAALDEAAESLVADGIGYERPREVGIMVEVPAAAMTADLLADEVDFFSIGSNDLVAYTMAADRTVSDVADLHQPGHPAILRLIEQVCRAASEAGAWVGVCGEMAAEPDHAEQLVRLGVRELSMAAAAIPSVKARLADVALEP